MCLVSRPFPFFPLCHCRPLVLRQCLVHIVRTRSRRASFSVLLCLCSCVCAHTRPPTLTSFRSCDAHEQLSLLLLARLHLGLFLCLRRVILPSIIPPPLGLLRSLKSRIFQNCNSVYIIHRKENGILVHEICSRRSNFNLERLPR